MWNLRVRLFVFCVVFRPIVCDYPCVCSSHVQRALYRKPDVSGYPTGFLYDSECGPQIQVASLNQRWLALAFNHKVVYIQRDFQVTRKICPGQPDPTDAALGLYPLIPTTTAPSLTHAPTSHRSTTHIPTTHGANTYYPIPTSYPPIPTPHRTIPHGPTPSPMPSTFPMFPWSTPFGPTSHEPITHGPTHWPTPSTPHIPTTYGPTPRVPSTHSSLAVSAHPIDTFWNSPYLQHGKYCYVLAPMPASWWHAKGICASSGGILLEVYNQDQQNYVQHFVQRYTPHPVWLGLTDIHQEEHFRWESGAPLNYKNWSPARQNPITHDLEDCAVLVPGARGGVWDDVMCGSEYSVFEQYQENHMFVCQYSMPSGDAAIIG